MPLSTDEITNLIYRVRNDLDSQVWNTVWSTAATYERRGEPTVSLTRPLPELTDARIAALFRGWLDDRRNTYADRRDFVRYANAFGTGSLDVCTMCSTPHFEDHLHTALFGLEDRHVCDICWRDYARFCDHCERPTLNFDELLEDEETGESQGIVCNVCRNNHYAYCGSCGGYYLTSPEANEEHAHREGCCKSAIPEFRIRNDGLEPLANDTRFSITLPGGEISDAGIRAIKEVLYDHDIYIGDVVEEVGYSWMGKRGTFTRRLSSAFWKRDKTKLEPEVLTQIGNLARDHCSTEGKTYHIEYTRQLNRSAREFVHAASCWWSSYSESRCALKTHGGFGLRSFSDEQGGHAIGRAWVMPMKLENDELVPTFDAEHAAAYVVFNGYEDLSNFVPARLLAQMVGYSYKKIEFGCNRMYINAGGILVAPQELCENTSSISLSLPKHGRLAQEERRLVQEAA